MNLFEVFALDADRAPSVPVFAESYNTAVQIYMVWWVCHGAGEVPGLEVRQCEPHWPGRNKQHLQDALAIGLAGVGRYDPRNGWLILWPNEACERFD